MSEDKGPGGAAYGCSVYSTDTCTSVLGANQGDILGAAETLCPGDVYTFDKNAAPVSLVLEDAAGLAGPGPFPIVGPGSDIGQPGAVISLDGRLTLMSEDGTTLEVLTISLTGIGAPACFLPLAPIDPNRSYTLIRAEAAPRPVPLAEIMPMALARGTRITLGDGTLCAVEDLGEGVPVMTRDHGPQPLRRIGRNMVRAIGFHAPVVVTKGAIGNAAELIVSQHKRVLVPQSKPRPIEVRAERLIPARQLVEGGDAVIREGGFVEYFHLRFDGHQIIYAEGAPAESVPMAEATLAKLPETMVAEIRRRISQAAFPDAAAPLADRRPANVRPLHQPQGG